ncbi:MAG: DUF6174 domain-containing protein [Nocardioides sp.]
MKLVALLVSALVGTTLALLPTSAHAAETPYAVQPFKVRPDDDARLAEAWRTWQDRGAQRYSTFVERACECLPEPATRTDVRNGRVTSVRFQGSDEESGRDGYEMDALYRLLREGYADADAVRVEYSSGVPVSIYIDWDERLADEETILTVELAGAGAPPSGYVIKPFSLRADDRPALKRAWRTWQRTGSGYYDTTVSRSAGEGTWPTVRTFVKGKTVFAVRVVGDSDAKPPRRGYEMDRLFRLVRSLYRSADEVTVRYGKRGAPRLISADPIKEAVDDEFFMRVTLRAGRRPAPRAAAAPSDGAPYRIAPFTTTSTDDPALAKGWKKWTSRDLDRYVTVVDSSCFCPPEEPLRTKVRGSRVTSVTFKGESRQQARPGYEMEALYRLLRRGYAEADRVDVTYHRGVPTQISIDWEEMMADEETYLSVRLVVPR